MATAYLDVIDRAQFRVTDYDVLKRSFQAQYDLMYRYMLSAVADFAPYCLIDLNDRDDELAQFKQTLDNECIEILALGIAYYWLSSRVLNNELLYNRLSTKEYSYFSPANLLREVQTLRDSVQQEYRGAIIRYTYRHGDVANPDKGV